MINITRSLIIILLCALITVVERAFPFLVFRKGKVPEFISYLGKVLGLAIMTSLVIYCLRGVSFSSLSSFAPQIIACIVTAVLHLWKNNALISILSGTIVCMVLTQLVFV